MIQLNGNLYLWHLIVVVLFSAAIIYLIIRIVFLRTKYRNDSHVFKKKQIFDELIIDSLPFSVILREGKQNHDDAKYSWNTIKWNLVTSNLLGNIRRKRLEDLFVPASYKLISKQVDEAVTLGNSNTREFSLTVSKGMREFDALSFVHFFKFDNRSFLLIIIADITELQIAKNLVEETGHEKTDFLASISHEIRTPLNSILGFSNLLLEEKDPELIQEFIGLVKQKNIELQNLINDILMLGKLDYHQIQRKMYVEDLIKTFKKNKPEYEKSIVDNQDVTLQYMLPYSFFNVLLDIQICPYIFSEFVHNAIKFTSHGVIRAGICVEKEKFIVFVHNQGNEIPLEKQIFIFKRFKKLDVFKQGTGLGLAICLAISSRYNGQIGVYSKKGFGTLFWASIPASGEIGEIDLSLEKEVSTLLDERWRGIWYDGKGTEPIIGVDDGELTINPYSQTSSSSSSNTNIINEIF